MNLPTNTLEHAAHPEWSGPTVFNGDTYDALHARFNYDNEMAHKVANALEAAAGQVVKERRNYEAHNLESLFPRNKDGDEKNNEEKDAQRKRYHELAGNPDTKGEFIAFFGKAALHALTSKEQHNTLPKATLQIIGKLQLGDWESTHDIDEYVRSIPDALALAVPGSKIENVGDDAELDNRYKYGPLLSDNGFNIEVDEYGLARRRRPVANIILPGLPKKYRIELFKESRFVLVKSQADEETRELIDKNADELSESDCEKHALEIAAAVGRICERAIKEPAGRTLDVHPVGADYFAVMRNPVFYPDTATY